MASGTLLEVRGSAIFIYLLSTLLSSTFLEASNLGGVAVSGLEMAQNSQRLQWTAEEVDDKLKYIMTNCFNSCLEAGSKWSNDPKDLTGIMPSLLTGANVSGFIKVADAMRDQGDWW